MKHIIENPWYLFFSLYFFHSYVPGIYLSYVKQYYHSHRPFLQQQSCFAFLFSFPVEISHLPLHWVLYIDVMTDDWSAMSKSVCLKSEFNWWFVIMIQRDHPLANKHCMSIVKHCNITESITMKRIRSYWSVFMLLWVQITI